MDDPSERETGRERDWKGNIGWKRKFRNNGRNRSGCTAEPTRDPDNLTLKHHGEGKKKKKHTASEDQRSASYRSFMILAVSTVAR